jgi:hypothetical protein
MKGMAMEDVATMGLTTPRERMQHYVDEAYKYSQSSHDGSFEEIVAIHDSRAGVAASAAIAEAIMHLAEVISNK